MNALQHTAAKLRELSEQLAAEAKNIEKRSAELRAPTFDRATIEDAFVRLDAVVPERWELQLKFSAGYRQGPITASFTVWDGSKHIKGSTLAEVVALVAATHAEPSETSKDEAIAALAEQPVDF